MLIDKPRLPIRQMLLLGWWPSAAKAWFYRLKGYRIGRGVRFAFGSIIEGKKVEIGDHVQLGFLSFVRGHSIRLGDHVQIGATTMIDTPYIDIGAGTRINEQVFIGGLQFPDSRLVVGRNCQIMQMSFINPARSITIGDDTGIGGHSLIFGHTSWLSAFEGYEVDFDSIDIGSSVSLAWRVFVLPGTRIGDGAVVGANSLVRGVVPPRSLAVGFPARVVSSGEGFIKVLDVDAKVRLLDRILTEFVGYIESAGFGVRSEGSSYEVRTPSHGYGKDSGRVWRLWVRRHDCEQLPTPQATGGTVDVVLSLPRLETPSRLALERANVAWVDIEAKEMSDGDHRFAEEVALYLRRYGVRFCRVSTRE